MAIDPDDYLAELYRTEAEQARLLHVTTHSLWVWRKKNSGPPWLRIGGRIYYRRESTAVWLAAQERAA
jgi:hypothetical protein